MTEYRRDIERAAKAHRISPDLLEAVVVTESSGHADAFRHEPGYYTRYLVGNPEFTGQIPRRVASSYGLCQILYPTAQQYGFTGQPEELFVPVTNLDLGAKILSALLEWAKGSVPKALQAYNGGKGGVGRPATILYAKRVLRHLDAIVAERARGNQA